MSMSKIRIIFLFSLVTFILTGCTVGRYVKNVSSDGQDIHVEKCTIKSYGQFYWDDNCSETVFRR